MNGSPIYLDYAAATPLDERVLAAMMPYLTDDFYNPSAVYDSGRKVAKAIEDARVKTAAIIGAKPDNIVFTAGATESVNLAIGGVMRAHPGGNIVTTAIEHQSVLKVAEVTGGSICSVRPNGVLDVDQLHGAISDDTVIVSIGMVNNEIGTIQPLKKISDLLAAVRRERLGRGNDMPIYLHADASQAIGHIDAHVHRIGVDLLTINSGKVYGPKQMAGLYVADGVKIEPMMFGGGQERGLRSGTENVAGIVGFATAAVIAEGERKSESIRLNELRKHALTVLSSVSRFSLNTDVNNSAHHILNFSIPGIDAERLLIELDIHGVMVATGSACAANKNTRSHVLAAIGLTPAEIDGSIRLSFGRQLDKPSLDTALELIKLCIAKQQGETGVS